MKLTNLAQVKEALIGGQERKMNTAALPEDAVNKGLGAGSDFHLTGLTGNSRRCTCDRMSELAPNLALPLNKDFEKANIAKPPSTHI